ncbi:MAG: family 20 glycosylhydrolase, partial [Chitinophagaceae bacterium]
MKKLFFIAAVFMSLLTAAQPKISIIPLPKKMVEQKGSFPLSNTVYLHYSNAMLKPLAALAVSGIKDAADISLQTKTGILQKNALAIKLLFDASITNDEGYVLDVTAKDITIKAKKEAGLFYGIQSLLQLIPFEGKKNIPAVHIEDEPRFQWRGMMMDPCRHFWSVDFIKKFIDQLAYHKLNKFHWHLTEDQGWRIEIKKYPRLQTVAAYRNGTQIGNDRKNTDSIRYGGYYTQEQVKEVVAYATARYVEVIPEIEMPGHSVAAVTAYPYLACNPVSFETGKPHEVRQVWGVSKDIYCAGNDSVFTFLQEVLTEVMPLFPSKYIHIGGDEAPHEAWAKCPKCQKRIKDEGLKNEAELQSWFVRRMEGFINSKGKKIIGWEEIMQGGLSPTATVHSWLGVESGLKASRMGNDVIMSPYSHLYFDGYQAEPKIEPLAIGYFTPIDTVYAFEPRHPQMSDADAAHLLGAQANLWTEFIATEPYFEYMAFPRMDALAEICWTPKEQKNYGSFVLRLQQQFNWYDKKNILYRIPTPVPSAVFAKDSVATVSLYNPAGAGVLRYELNHDNVSANSPEYLKPINVRPGETLRFALFRENGRQSSTDYFPKKQRKK